MKGLTIAIDGSSGSGKGTLARKLSEHYGIKWLDTGKLYRIVAYRLNASTKNLDFTKIKATDIAAIAKNIKCEDLYSVDSSLLVGEDIARIASLISGLKCVRENLLDVQRDFASNGAILDGRDIGTVILPNADVKFFLYADENIRAQRRYSESLEFGLKCSFEEILNKMQERDYRDKNRAESPMERAEDCVFIDTTNLSILELFECAVEIIDKKCSEKL